MKQTAVEWLVEQLSDEFSNYPDAIIEQAKEMEREQIIEAYDAGLYDTTFCEKVHAEQYYNETFKSE